MLHVQIETNFGISPNCVPGTLKTDNEVHLVTELLTTPNGARNDPTVVHPKRNLHVYEATPRYGLRFFGPKKGIPSDRLSSSSAKLSVSMILYDYDTHIYIVLGHRHVGRVARTNVFEIMFRVMLISSFFLVLRAQKILRICCTPSVG